MRTMYDPPCVSVSTLLLSISNPVTRNFCSLNSSTSGSPTYPMPITPMRAVRFSSFLPSASNCGEATVCTVSITTFRNLIQNVLQTSCARLARHVSSHARHPADVFFAQRRMHKVHQAGFSQLLRHWQAQL